MKKVQIRQQVFETNSSSTHSISIADVSKQFIMDVTLLPDQFGNIILKGGEFGWNWDKTNNALTKANYAAVDQCMGTTKVSKMRKKILEQVIKEQTGAKEVLFRMSTDHSDTGNWSYVDHQSQGTANDAFADKESLRNFIFNLNSWLFTGNDNSTAHPEFFDVPEYKKDMIVQPQYTHELKIEGLEKTSRFKSNPTEDDIQNALSSILQDVTVDKTGFFDEEGRYNDNNDDWFKYTSYMKEPDIKAKIIYFVRDAPLKEVDRFYKKNHPRAKKSTPQDYGLWNAIKDGLYNEEKSPYVKAVKFNIVEIKEV